MTYRQITRVLQRVQMEHNEVDKPFVLGLSSFLLQNLKADVFQI